MTAIETGLQDLRRQHPEWEPWLAVVQEVLSETVNPEWDSLVPIRSESQQSNVPLLSGITLALERRASSSPVGKADFDRPSQRDAGDGQLGTGTT